MTVGKKKNVDGFELSFSSNWIKHLEGKNIGAFIGIKRG